MYKYIIFIFLVLLLGCEERLEVKSEPSVQKANYIEFTLQDGTRCVVTNNSIYAHITCNWGWNR